MFNLFKKFELWSNHGYDNKLLIRMLKSNKEVARQVVGRGTLIMNEKALSKTKAFRDYASKGREIVANTKSA